jgi:hypothetical protein
MGTLPIFLKPTKFEQCYRKPAASHPGKAPPGKLPKAFYSINSQNARQPLSMQAFHEVSISINQ